MTSLFTNYFNVIPIIIRNNVLQQYPVMRFIILLLFEKNINVKTLSFTLLLRYERKIKTK